MDILFFPSHSPISEESRVCFTESEFHL